MLVKNKHHLYFVKSNGVVRKLFGETHVRQEEQRLLRIDAKPTLLSPQRTIEPPQCSECLVKSSIYTCSLSTMMILLPSILTLDSSC